ncbi:MAG: hypothetical protein WA020_10440 [Candidatus Acidiferrales bacterium]
MAYYQHADWIGSARFASTPSRTVYNDLAYAPFGEPYAQSGSTGVTDIAFAGMDENTTANAYDAVNRELWSPGPLALARPGWTSRSKSRQSPILEPLCLYDE